VFLGIRCSFLRSGIGTLTMTMENGNVSESVINTNGADMSPVPWDDRMAQFEWLCRHRRLPLTAQRRAIFQAILGRQDHPTVDQLYAQIRRRLPNVSRTSVYRILELLVETGMITKICHPGSAARFDPKLHQHHHLVCLSCECILDIEEPRLNHLPLPQVRTQGFQIQDYHIHFRGLCARCVRKPQARSRAVRPVGRPPAGVHRPTPKGTRGTARKPVPGIKKVTQ
jgi:Fur family transcriptional regulator, peroxide stress response regulator